ncbi:MAG: hypothetical protein ACK5MF_00420 [Vibrio sp.]|uniref:hypothetical protein n=1 Tax=Vibrio sp. TaxID=678 RepID=UPI003A84EBE7
MAIKHFLATCEKKVSKHPVKDGKTLTVPTLATTQADAKTQVRVIVEKRDLELASSEFTYNDWYKTPQLEPITEEEYNAELLAFEGESTTDYPVLNDAGYYDDHHEDAELSQFIFTNNGQEFEGAKVFVLKVADNQWSYGFKFVSSHTEKYEPMTQDKLEDSRDEAIDKGIGRLERFLDYHDEYGPEEDKRFISALLDHDFYAGFSIEEKTEEQLEITLSEETKASKKRIEEVFNKSAANDSVFKPIVKKAVMNITDDIHAVISTINLNDEGYAYGFEVNSKTERLAGNVDSISEERFATEREAVKHAGQAISDCLATYDTSLTLYKAFAQSKYIDYFEENSMVMGEQEDPIKTAIRKRFEARPTAQTNESEVSHAFEIISHLITEHTDIEALIKAIETTQKCNEMYMSPQVDQLVARCTPTPSKLNTTIYKAVQQRLKKAGIADEEKVMTAHDYIAPNITDKTDIDKLCDTIAKLKNPHNLLVPANACLLAMQSETEKQDKSPIPWDGGDEFQVFISNCLVTNDAHLDFSPEQYEEMSDKLKTVIEESYTHSAQNNVRFDEKATLKNIENNEWVSGSECALDFLNIRRLRALFRENLETTQQNETEKTTAFVYHSDTIDRQLNQDCSNDVTISNVELAKGAIASFTMTDNERVLRVNGFQDDGWQGALWFEFSQHDGDIPNATYQLAIDCLCERMGLDITLKSKNAIFKDLSGRFHSHRKIKEGQKTPNVGMYEDEKKIAHKLVKETGCKLSLLAAIDQFINGIMSGEIKKLSGNTLTPDVIGSLLAYGITESGDLGESIDLSIKNREKSLTDFYLPILDMYVKGALTETADHEGNILGVMKKQAVNNEPEPEKSLPEDAKDLPNQTKDDQNHSKSEPNVERNNVEHITTATDDNSNSDVPQEVIKQDAANEPINVVTIADLPDGYQNNPNLALWMKGFKTNLQHVKPDQNGRLSIKTQYRLMKATEIWGPIGVGWGYRVIREWIDTGAPIIMNGEISQFFEQIHKVEIEFWYRHEGEKVSFTQYGDTRKLYLARGGYFVHDDEVEKKSLSDALGKAMSMTGICADVYLGTYDGDTLINKTEQIQLANRQLKQLEFDAQTAELAINKAKSYTDKFSTAPSMAEIKRLEKLAITALAAYPTPDEDSKRKKSKAIGAIAIQAQSAIDDFNKDLNTTQQEQANG